MSASEQGHGDVFDGGKFGQQIMELPDVTDFAVAKLGSGTFGKRVHLEVGAVYGTGGRTIKCSQDVQ